MHFRSQSKGEHSMEINEASCEIKLSMKCKQNIYIYIYYLMITQNLTSGNPCSSKSPLSPVASQSFPKVLTLIYVNDYEERVFR